MGKLSTKRFEGAVGPEEPAPSSWATEARQRALLSAIPDLILRFDREGTLVDLHGSDRWEAWRRCLARGGMDELLPPPASAELGRLVAEAAATGEPQVWRCDLSTAHGPQAVEARLVAIGDGEVLTIVRDATEQRQAERLRARFVERVLQAQEEERRRIARELHDETGQKLTTTAVLLAAVEDATSAEEAIQCAREARRLLAQVADEVGRLARGLHPHLLEDLGFGAAVRRLVTDLGQHHGVHTDLHIGASDSLARQSWTLRTAAYRILQEALNNVAKHAHAHNVSVVIRTEPETLLMVIEDDGVGFDPADASWSGLGLYGIRERTRLLDGSFELDSEPGRGTTLAVRIPLNAGPDLDPQGPGRQDLGLERSRQAEIAGAPTQADLESGLP